MSILQKAQSLLSNRKGCRPYIQNDNSNKLAKNYKTQSTPSSMLLRKTLANDSDDDEELQQYLSRLSKSQPLATNKDFFSNSPAVEKSVIKSAYLKQKEKSYDNVENSNICELEKMTVNIGILILNFSRFKANQESFRQE